MSLKRHIEVRTSPVAKFLRSQFPNVRSFMADARKQVRQATTIRPVVGVPLDIIGVALDYRIRYYFAITPHEQLVAYRGARYLTEQQSEEASGELGFRWAGKRNDSIEIVEKTTGRVIWNHLPERNGGWGIVDPGMELGARAFALAEKVAAGEIAHEKGGTVPLKSEFRDFFDSLNRITQENSPIGTRLAQLREDELNRHCIVLAFLEQASRTHRIDGVLNASRFSDARALLSIAESHWIDDLRELSWLFFDKYGDLSSLPFVLNPTFQGSSYVGGADADLIVDGTLIDIKCTIKNDIQPNWLMQVLAYVLLDFSDKYRISGIGIYMARHGLLFQWDLDELLAELCPGETPSTAYLRERFKDVTGGLNRRLAGEV